MPCENTVEKDSYGFATIHLRNNNYLFIAFILTERIGLFIVIDLELKFLLCPQGMQNINASGVSSTTPKDLVTGSA